MACHGLSDYANYSVSFSEQSFLSSCFFMLNMLLTCFTIHQIEVKVNSCGVVSSNNIIKIVDFALVECECLSRDLPW